MVFSSLVFLFLFLPAVLAGYYLILRGHRRGQNVFLLLTSLVFYGYGAPRFLPVMMASIGLCTCFGLWAGARRARGEGVRGPVAAACVVHFGLLFVLKYLSGLLVWLGLPAPGLSLPVGISFFTFQAVGYVADVAAGRVKAERDPLSVGLYLAFFPQLVAGPIVKYSAFSRQLWDRREAWADFAGGLKRFGAGLCKKVLLANQLALVADRCFAMERPAASLAWLGLLCYALQIYYDFSGYSDMALGLGKLFGFSLPENFRRPYGAGSVTDFWRRWHISLSSWFRDYVYLPLGGSRSAARGRCLGNLLVVWLFPGVWHGGDGTFLLWGLFHFLLVAAEKYGGLGKSWPRWLRHGYTLLTVGLGWVLFRAESLSAAGGYYLALLGANGLWDAQALFYARETWAALAVGMLLCLPPVWRNLSGGFGRLAGPGRLALAAVAVAYLVKDTYHPFLYFQF